MIRALMDAGQVVVAAGGGGIPVMETEGNHLKGAAAVIDKDFCSACLAELVDADCLIILTAVEKVAINFGKPNQEWLSELTPERARVLIAEGHFAPGSMLPKVQAAVQFSESKADRYALITLLEKAKDGIEGKTDLCGDVIKAFRTQEKTVPRAARTPDDVQRLPQRRVRITCFKTEIACAALWIEAAGNGNRFQNRRFSRAVFSNKKGYRRSQYQFPKPLNRRQLHRIAAVRAGFHRNFPNKQPVGRCRSCIDSPASVRCFIKACGCAAPFHSSSVWPRCVYETIRPQYGAAAGSSISFWHST